MLGNLIRERRKELNLTQAELAELVGYGEDQSIGAIERGRYSPQKRFACKLAQTLSIDWDEFSRLKKIYQDARGIRQKTKKATK